MRPFFLVCTLLCAVPLPSAAQSPGADRVITLLGGSDDEIVRDMVIAPDGSVYVVGTTESPDFPVTDGAYDTTLGGDADAFVAHLSADLSTVLSATFLGGSESGGPTGSIYTRDIGYGIVLNGEAVFVAGFARTADFPITNGAFQQEKKGGQDAFVARLSLDLSTLEASTYFGANGAVDVAVGIAIDSEGDVVIAGNTFGPGFPLSEGAYASNSGATGGPFVARLSPDLTELRTSTLFGASGDANAFVVDPVSGDVAIVGSTLDGTYPSTPNAYDPTCGTDGACDSDGSSDGSKSDVFVSRMSRDATTLVASTFLGGEGFDFGYTLHWSGDEIVVAGAAASQAFPVSSDAFQTAYADGQQVGFVARLDAMLTSVSRSTLFAGTVSRSPSYVIEVYVEPGTGRVHTTGQTRADDFPLTSDAFDQEFTGEWEQFYSVFEADLSDLAFSSFLGGTDANAAGGPTPSVNAIAVSSSGDLYVAGAARSADFATTDGAFQTELAGAADGFIARLNAGVPVASEGPALSDPSRLLASYPNPFASDAIVRFHVRETGAVRLAVYDVRGREAAVLIDGTLAAGPHEARLDGAGLASGTYFVRFVAGVVAETQAITLLR